MRKTNLFVGLASSLLALSACGGTPKPSAHWYDPLVEEGYTAAKTFPLDGLKTFLGVESIPELPDLSSLGKNGFAYTTVEKTEQTYAYFDVCVEGDASESIATLLGDAFISEDQLSYVSYLKADRQTNFELDVGLAAFSEDATEADFTYLTFYKVTDMYSLTLNENTAWTEDDLTVFAALGDDMIPFMQFSEDYRTQYDEDYDVYYVYDFYLYDLTANYIELVTNETNGYVLDTESGMYVKEADAGTIALDIYWDMTYGNCVDVYFEAAAPVATKVVLDKTTAQVEQGASLVLNASLDVEGEATYTAEADKDYATVAVEGSKVTVTLSADAVVGETVTVTVSSGELTPATCAITVLAKPVATKVVLDKTSAEIEQDSAIVLQASLDVEGEATFTAKVDKDYAEVMVNGNQITVILSADAVVGEVVTVTVSSGDLTPATCAITVLEKGVVPPSPTVTDESVVFSEQGYTNAQAVTSYTGKNCTITFAKGSNNSNAPAYYDTGAAIRCYAGNTFTITSESSITKVVLTFGSGDKTNDITASTGTYEGGTWTGSANEVTFTIGGTSGHRRVASIAITYAAE